MLATKNRAATLTLSLLATVVLLVACAPPGPRAFTSGKKHLEQGDFAAAIEELRTATALMPSNAAAWNYFGVALHQGGQMTNALAAYAQALKFDRDLLEARFNLGCLWLELGNAEAAKAELFSFTSRRPNDGLAWTKLGAAQLQTREIGLAEKSFREALRVDAKDVVAMNGLGIAAAQRNRWKDAAEFFAATLKLQPDYRPALLNAAGVCLQLGDRSGAVVRYRAFLALQPRDADWPAIDALVQSLDPLKASGPMARSSVAPPSIPSVSATNVPRVTAVANPRTSPVSKVELPTNSSAPTPESKPSAIVARPAAIPAANQPLSAATEVAALSLGAAANSTNTSTSNGVTVTYANGVTVPATPEKRSFFSKLNPFRRSSNSTTPLPEDAKALEQNSASIVGNNPSAVGIAPNPQLVNADGGDRSAATRELVRGQSEQRAKRLAEAIRFYRRAVELDDSYFEAHFALGAALFESRDLKGSVSAWERAITLRPNSADARYNLALTLKAAAQFQQASDELEKLLSLHPDEARGHLVLGNLYAEQLNDIPRARKHYNRVLQLDPRNSQAQAIRYWLVNHPG